MQVGMCPPPMPPCNSRSHVEGGTSCSRRWRRPRTRLLPSAPLPAQGAQHLLHNDPCNSDDDCNLLVYSNCSSTCCQAGLPHPVPAPCTTGLCAWSALPAQYPVLSFTAMQLKGPGTLRLASEPAHCLWPCAEGKHPGVQPRVMHRSYHFQAACVCICPNSTCIHACTCT
jgi:hypothetical protein